MVRVWLHWNCAAIPVDVNTTCKLCIWGSDGLMVKALGFWSGVHTPALPSCHYWALNPLCYRGAVSWLTLCSVPNFLTWWDMQRKQFHCLIKAHYRYPIIMCMFGWYYVLLFRYYKCFFLSFFLCSSDWFASLWNTPCVLCYLSVASNKWSLVLLAMLTAQPWLIISFPCLTKLLGTHPSNCTV